MPIMGKQESDRKARAKAKAAGVPVAPVAKRPAAAGPPGAPPRKAAASSKAAPSKAPSPYSCTSLPPAPFPEADQEKGEPWTLVDSVSASCAMGTKGRGKVGCTQYMYKEGVDGKYTCAECLMKFLRSWFMIEAQDLEGNLTPERDVEGYLYGRCYECCRGRGPRQTADIYEKEKLELTEDDLKKKFKKSV